MANQGASQGATAAGGNASMDNITIDVARPEQGLFGTDELWITVTSPSPLPDYTTIRRLTIQRGLSNGTILPENPLRYYPAWGGPDEPFSELWVVGKVEA